MPTDKQMLDWLEEQNNKCTYTGTCIFRWSRTGRGWRLHETSEDDSQYSVRDAICDAMENDEGKDGG